MLKSFPLLLVAIIMYNVIVFGGVASGTEASVFLDRYVSIAMFSGDVWRITFG